MPFTQAELSRFEALLGEQARHTERECGEFLPHAVTMLLNQTPLRIVELPQEYRSHFGRSDFLILADIAAGTGAVHRVAYFWELKAPQAPLMQRDDALNRFRPTTELLKAETQLIHYWSEARGSNVFKQRYDIRYDENIRMGGIIIGRDGRVIAQGSEVEKDDADHSFHMRNAAFYEKAHIAVMTWDRVLQFFVRLLKAGT